MQSHTNIEYIAFLNKVERYISTEYDNDLVAKMRSSKFENIVKGYIKNCMALNKTVPYVCYEVVRLLKKSS